jgi:dihydroxy-acid dehydratase
VLAERSAKASARLEASPWNSRSTRSRKPASARRRAWTATCRIWAWSRLLYGYPLDGVVLTIGCDKTTPACLMAAATVNIPAIALSVGPMLNGWHKGQRTGSGTIVWKAREMLAAGEIDRAGFIKLVASSAPSTGYCNTMGTATTMNSLTEALGMSLPGSAAIPAPYRDRQRTPTETGLRIVDMTQRTSSRPTS